jgi:hypothetical protein
VAVTTGISTGIKKSAARSNRMLQQRATVNERGSALHRHRAKNRSDPKKRIGLATRRVVTPAASR